MSLHLNGIKSSENIGISLNILSIKGTHLSHIKSKIESVIIWLDVQLDFKKSEDSQYETSHGKNLEMQYSV